VILSHGASTRPDAWIYSCCMCAVHQALSTHRIRALADHVPHPPAQQGLGVEKKKKCGPDASYDISVPQWPVLPARSARESGVEMG
jgi:hypothetical protein